MKSFALLFLSLFIFGCQSSPLSPFAQTPKGLSILQGTTDSTSTLINIVVPKESQYTYTFLLDSTVLHTPPLKEKTWGDSKWKVVTIALKGLNPGSIYDLKVSNKDGEIIDARTFKTFSLSLKNPSIAVASCLDDKFSELQKQQWQEVWFQKPDALFLIGDNVYIDTHTLGSVDDAFIWKRHIETRQNLELYRMKMLIPTFATWDDHDFGAQDGDTRFKYKDMSKEIFQTFFPVEDSSFTKKGPGVSSSLTINKQTFIFFDDRSFRTPDRTTPNDTHFGVEQETWFLKTLKKSKGPVWLISGDQFFGAYHPFESYEGNHAISFKSFLNKLKNSKKTFIFISGDRHLAEIMKIPKKTLGFETYEFTSSGIHATMYPDALKKNPNPRQIFGVDGKPHFLILKTLSSSARGLKLEASFYGEKSSLLHRANHEIKQ